MSGVNLGLIGGFNDTYDFGSTVTMPKVAADIGVKGKVVYEIINGEKTIKTFEVTKEMMESISYKVNM